MYNPSDLYVVAVKNDTGTDTLICKKGKKIMLLKNLALYGIYLHYI